MPLLLAISITNYLEVEYDKAFKNDYVSISFTSSFNISRL
jgi:hypothetical protein